MPPKKGKSTKVKAAKKNVKARSNKTTEKFDSKQSKKEALDDATLLHGQKGSSTLKSKKSKNDDRKTQAKSQDERALSESLSSLSPVSDAEHPEPPAKSTKRKRGQGDKQPPTASSSNNAEEETPEEAPEEVSRNKRRRSISAEPPKTSPAKRLPHPNQKQIRSILRQLAELPAKRIELRAQLEQMEKMVRVAQSTYEQTEVELTEMQWARYVIEEDLLRQMKKDPHLVDGTQRLGVHSRQGKDWKEWVKANRIEYQMDDMGWENWKNKDNEDNGGPSSEGGSREEDHQSQEPVAQPHGSDAP
ncbi:hypothetical protein GYMLUDRAFT_238784 [Collybiopsis luxurians FD-317 M1]|nr:hypothetical protein GYMLUDRAFT_238784 [Collybiopsis luxurians FD-317 M1]